MIRTSDIILRAGGGVLKRHGVIRKRTAPWEEIPAAFARSTVALEFDAMGVVRQAAVDVPRVNHRDLDGDGVRETLTIPLQKPVTQLCEFNIPGGGEAAFEIQTFGALANPVAEWGLRIEPGDDYRIPMPANGEPLDDFTASVWAIPDWASNDGVEYFILDVRKDSTDFIFIRKHPANHRLEVVVQRNGAATTTAYLLPDVPLVAGVPFFVGARIYDDTLYIYHDQNLDNTLEVFSLALPGTFATGGWVVSPGTVLGAAHFEGVLNILITNDGSTDDAIQDRFNAGAAMPPGEVMVQSLDPGVLVRDTIVIAGPHTSDGETHSWLRYDPVFTPGTTGFGAGVYPYTGMPASPGTPGFGVGQYLGALPSGMTAMIGSDTVGHDNYGNYIFANSQSVMVWIPRFYYRITNDTSAPFNGTKIDISPLPLDGYVVHRAFIDGGVSKAGFFVDKYLWSNALSNGNDNTDTTGGIAASVASRRPVSTNAGNNRISYLTGNSQTPTDTHGGVYAAAKSRGDDFAPLSVFCHSALAMLSLAHAQAEPSTAIAAWMDVLPYAPKGCNDNALGDAQDGAISYMSSGFQNQPLTGSGTPFAKTTHNGQACGVADLNGGTWEFVSGFTNVGGPTAATYRILSEAIALKDLIDATSGAFGAFGTTPYDLMGSVWWADADAWWYFGNGTNQVLSGETNRAALDYYLASIGIMKDANGGSASQNATNNFGGDGFYRKHTNLLAPIAGGRWDNGSNAGIWNLNVNTSRSASNADVGSRAVLYV